MEERHNIFEAEEVKWSGEPDLYYFFIYSPQNQIIGQLALQACHIFHLGDNKTAVDKNDPSISKLFKLGGLEKKISKSFENNYQ